MSSIKVTNINNASAASGGIAFDADGHVTVDGLQLPSAGALSNRNKIINGDMRIDQRNAGASISTNGGFPVDRWITYFLGTGVLSAQRSTDTPVGFVNSLKLTVTTANPSLGATDFAILRHNVEGYNIGDLAWGTANAKTVNLSFWVKSSVPGTYGGAIHNNALNRGYAFTYSISSANTWEPITVPIPGDTTGTWLTDNSKGLGLNFDLGIGSTYRETAGSWSSKSSINGATGATDWISNSGATFYLTGVQLEVGAKATPFEHRSYGDELARCQRYFFSSFPQGTAPAKGVANTVDLELPATSASFAPNRYFGLQHRQNMRGPAAITFYNSQNGSAANNTIKAYYWVDGGTTGSGDYTVNLDVAGHNSFGGYIATSGYGNAIVRFHYTASAEL